MDGIIKATVCLHNYLKKKDGNNGPYAPSSMVDKEDVDGNQRDGDWREMVDKQDIKDFKFFSSYYKKEAGKNRENFVIYFSSTKGSVPWQEKIVQRGEFIWHNRLWLLLWLKNENDSKYKCIFI